MNYNEIILENNALLKVLIRQQARMNVILSEAIDRLNGHPKNTEAKQELRQTLMEAEYQLLITQADMIKTMMQYEDLAGNR